MASDSRSLEAEAELVNPLGYHVSLAKPDYLLGSVRCALAGRATALMVFLGSPRTTRLPEADSLKCPEAFGLWEEKGRERRNLVVHFPYIINPSSPDPQSRMRAQQAIRAELQLMEECGLSLCCLHPGSSLNGDRLALARQGFLELAPIFAEFPGIRIGIENMAGKGSEVGVGLMEIKLLLEAVPLPNVGLCLDTCHLWDSGFPVDDVPLLERTVAETIGLDKLFLIHLNDSVHPRGSHRDRHANLGKGCIGFRPLCAIVASPAFRSVPKILETPEAAGASTHAHEVELLRKGAGL